MKYYRTAYDTGTVKGQEWQCWFRNRVTELEQLDDTHIRFGLQDGTRWIFDLTSWEAQPQP